MSTGVLRSAFRWVMALPTVPECLAGITHSEATIFMAHRFSVPEEGITGHDPQNLYQILAELRKRRYELVSIAEIFRRSRDREPMKRAVAFTIDDGYHDAAHVAAPIFAEFDCPVTIFAITGFLDGFMWLWWDKIAYIFAKTKRAEIEVRLGKESLTFRLDGPATRTAWRSLVGQWYEAPSMERESGINELSESADVELPLHAPQQFRALSWGEARELERKGVTFGPHTMTHPILSTASAEESEREIAGSWDRVRAEMRRPVPIFCYPGGESIHFGDREIATLGHIGLWGAVTGVPGNIRSGSNQQPAQQLYRMPRYMYQETLPSILQCVSGMQGIKGKLRRRLAAE